MAKAGDEVVINYFFRSDTTEEVDIRENFTFTLGRGELLPEIENAIKDMRVGEKRSLSAQVGETRLIGDIELIEITDTMKKAKHNILPQSEVNQIASQKKELGNNFIKDRKFKEAISMFEEAVAVFKTTGGEWAPGTENDIRTQLELACFLNMAFCYLNIDGQEPRVIEAATKALAIDSNNVKALYRRAMAYKQFGELDKAKKDCVKAAKLEPSNSDIRALLDEIKASLSHAHAVEMKSYSKVFSPVPSDPTVWLEIAIDEKVMGRIVFKLYASAVPKTCHNFISHCKAGNFKNSVFHKLIHGYVIQGGDFEYADGTGGFSYHMDGTQTRFFDDESFSTRSHDKRGLLSMANSGPNTNTSQFFITLGAAEKLDGKHVLFGEVSEGLDLLDVIETVECDVYKRPQKKIHIVEVGCN